MQMSQLRAIIWKQWKVPSKREWGLEKLGIKKWQAHTLSYCKGYWSISRLPQIKKAISKKRLIRRWLVSPLDYYFERHALKLNSTAVCRTARTVV